MLQAAVQQFYTDHAAPPEIHLPVAFPAADTEMLEGWLSERAERRVRFVVPRRGEKRGLLDLATRNAEVAYQARFNENVAAHYDALETLRAVLALPVAAAAHRVLRHLDDPGQRDRRVDGRLRRRADEAVGIPEVQDPGSALGARRSGSRGHRRQSAAGSTPVAADVTGLRAPSRRAASPESWTTSPRCTKSSSAATASCSRPAGRFPDLILIDGGKGQLSAAYEALEELGLANARGGRDRQEGGAALHARSRRTRLRCATDSPALLLIQRIRDEAHRFAVTFHRASRTQDADLRSELDEIAGIGPRRRKALLTAFGSVAGVRRATREELVRVVGAKSADAVLAHFADCSA